MEVALQHNNIIIYSNGARLGCTEWIYAPLDCFDNYSTCDANNKRYVHCNAVVLPASV